MNIGTVFKISLYSLTGYVGVILGIAESEGALIGTTRLELFLPYLSVPVVLFGYLFTESRTGNNKAGSGLSAIWANSFGLIALVATAYEFTRENRESKLLAGTHLLLYATWIVLFQQKSVRSYWFLLALGNLQLSIASVLTQSGWFGFAAVCYLFASVWTLSIFSLWRAEQLFDKENEASHDVAVQRVPESGSANQLRIRRSSESRGTIQHEGGTHWLTSRFVSGVLTTAFAALVVSMGFFAFIPRVWVGADFSFQDDFNRLAGISRQQVQGATVRLGDLSHSLESNEKVFEMRITRIQNDEKIPVAKFAEILGLNEPLFRSGVMTTYAKGNWKNDRPGDAPLYSYAGLFGGGRSSGPNDVRQDIHVERAESGPLFFLGRFQRGFFNRRYRVGDYEESMGVLYRGDNTATEYSVITTMPRQQRPYFKLGISNVVSDQYARSNYLELNTKLSDSLARLKELAIQIVEKEKVAINRRERKSKPRELTPIEKANAIEYYLRDSGQYVYSLDVSAIDAKIDPIEDFLFNRKQGHCEYFATALTLMCRAVGIPARVVTGYKGGIDHDSQESAESREYPFEVQKRFAHLWSEAWVDDSGSEAWTTFDATPVDARANSVASVAAKKASLWVGMTTTLSGLWSDGILNLSLERQEESIYKPMRELGYAMSSFVYELFTSPESALDTLKALIFDPKNRISSAGLFVGMGIFAILAAFCWIIRKRIRSFFGWLLSRTRRRLQRRRIIEFYERFLRIAKRHGFVRGPSQTQQEFSLNLATEFQSRLYSSELNEAPNKISTLFYRVRFGDEELTVEEAKQIEGTLSALEHALSHDSTRRAMNGTTNVKNSVGT